jgi:hypothetical protein
MLLEALNWVATPAPDWARQAGYLKELIALQARHRRWRTQWAPHHQACRAAIRAAMAQCRTRRHALIYGSGLLNDIPLGELAAAFERVTLVDVAHLWPQRLTAHRYPNVAMIERDISGVALSLLHGVAMGADRLPAPKPKPPEEPAAFDFVVSANLMSQLAVVPLRFLAGRGPLPADAANAYARDIAKAHLDHLNGFEGVRCLIADTKRQIVARDGTVQRTEAQLPGVSLPLHNRSWWWELAPFGEISRNSSLLAHVVAITMLPDEPADSGQ